MHCADNHKLELDFTVIIAIKTRSYNSSEKLKETLTTAI